jgi:hypothetical protein
MCGIYANIGGILMVNVTIYSIHGSYGLPTSNSQSGHQSRRPPVPSTKIGMASSLQAAAGCGLPCLPGGRPWCFVSQGRLQVIIVIVNY